MFGMKLISTEKYESMQRRIATLEKANKDFYAMANQQAADCANLREQLNAKIAEQEKAEAEMEYAIEQEPNLKKKVKTLEKVLAEKRATIEKLNRRLKKRMIFADYFTVCVDNGKCTGCTKEVGDCCKITVGDHTACILPKE